jgi:hypothetical protein
MMSVLFILYATSLMTHNITAPFVKTTTLITNLANEADATVDKYVQRALSIVLSYINGQQFYDAETDTYTFPEQLILAVVYVVETIYLDQGMFAGKNNLQSESIGDYSYSKKQDAKVLPLDLPANIMAMLDPYKNWCGNLDVDVG